MADVPQVSIIMPACNAGRTIGTALDSVFAQTFRDFELIVVDEGSTDDTARVVERCRERHAGHSPIDVKLLRAPDSGTSCAHNIGVGEARGRLIAFLGADDVWLPRKLERQVYYFERFPSTGLLHAATLAHRYPRAAAVDARDVLPLDTPCEAPTRRFDDLFHGTHVIDSATVLAPSALIADAGGFDERHGPRAVQDWDLWLRIAARHPVGYLPMTLAVHRLGGASSTATEETIQGRQRVVDRLAPLCADACATHRGDGDACVREQRRTLYVELARARVRCGRINAAADAYREAIAHGLPGARPRVYSAAASVVGGVLERCAPAQRVVDRVIGRPDHASPAVDLVRDTAYGRSRAAAMRCVHAVDDAISAAIQPEVRVLFEAASPVSLAVFRPVLDRLRADSRIQVWFTTSDGSWDANDIFRAAGITDHIVTSRDARWMKFDAYINTDFWNMTWLPRRTMRIHTFHGVAGKYELDAPTGIAPVVTSFDCLMFPNRDRLQKYADAGLVDPDGDGAALIGFPKVDCLVDGSLDRSSIQQSLGLDPSLPTVLYAPTWSPYSSLLSHGFDIVENLSGGDWNVVVKLHDRSYERSARGSGGVDWRRTLERIGRGRRLHMATDADASPYLFAADALITDHSSVGFEFLLLDRPLTVVDCPKLVEMAQISRGKVDLLRSAAVVVSNGRQAARAVADGLTRPARLSERRREIAEQLFYCAGTATARAVACIYRLLALPPPTEQPISGKSFPTWLPANAPHASEIAG